MMDCVLASQLLGDYVTGDLEPDEWEAVREHLDGCPECRAEASVYLKIVRIARQLALDGLPRPVEARLRRTLLLAPWGRTFRRRGGFG